MRGAVPEDSYELNPTQLTTTTEREIPHDAEAEASVLSAMLASRDILEDCLAQLTHEDFYLPSNRTIFEAMATMHERAQVAVDLISLADFLKSAGTLERVGGRARLIDLGNDPLAVAGWENHVRMLRRDTTLRRMITASAQITALAFDAPEDTTEVVQQAEKMLLDVTDRDVRSGYERIEEVMTSLYDELTRMEQAGDEPLGVNTGFPSLDRMLMGLRPGQMLVVGARPGVGKTAFALNLALNAAADGSTVALFSLEMSKMEIAQRLLASEASSVNLAQIRSGRIPHDAWDDVLSATNRVSCLDILIDDTPGTTVTEIRTKARRMLHNKERAVVIVDYLQLLSPPAVGRRSDSRATEVSEMSRGLKIMAKELGCPVVALSQLNREVESRAGGRGEGRKSKRPQLSDLRESGSIEQDADIVLLLDRSTTDEEAAREDRPDKGVTDVIVAKNRSGPLGVVSLGFAPERTKFLELDRYHEG